MKTPVEKTDSELTGGIFTLCGRVRSHAERDEAARVFWAATGVWLVDNQIDVTGSLGFEN